MLLLAFLAAAPVASHACDGEKEKWGFVMFTTTFVCLIFGMMGMCFLGRAST